MRLRTAIKLAGYPNVAAFAVALGLNPITVRKHVTRDSVPGRMAETYVRRLAPVGVTTDWLLFGKGPPPRALAADPSATEHTATPKPTPAPAPALALHDGRSILGALSTLTSVIGEIVDDGVVRFYDTDEARGLLATLPRPPKERTPRMFGLVVETERLRPRYRAGDLLFMLAGHYDSDWHRYANSECIVQVARAGCLLRHIRHAATPDRATLTTIAGADLENATIIWAVPVTWVRRAARPRMHSARTLPKLASDQWAESMTTRPHAPFMSEQDARALSTGHSRKSTH